MRKPGAVSSARFMQQAIYLLKIAMLHGQGARKFTLDRTETSCVLALAEFVVLFYVPHYLQARIAPAAPRLDRDLFVGLQHYQDLHANGSNRYTEIHMYVCNNKLISFIYIHNRLISRWT